MFYLLCGIIESLAKTQLGASDRLIGVGAGAMMRAIFGNSAESAFLT